MSGKPNTFKNNNNIIEKSKHYSSDESTVKKPRQLFFKGDGNPSDWIKFKNELIRWTQAQLQFSDLVCIPEKGMDYVEPLLTPPTEEEKAADPYVEDDYKNERKSVKEHTAKVVRSKPAYSAILLELMHNTSRNLCQEVEMPINYRWQDYLVDKSPLILFKIMEKVHNGTTVIGSCKEYTIYQALYLLFKNFQLPEETTAAFKEKFENCLITLESSGFMIEAFDEKFKAFISDMIKIKV